MVRLGLNPYGIAYCNGLMAQGTSRANPAPNSLDAYLALAQEAGVEGIELDLRQLAGLDDAGLQALGRRLAAIDYFVVLSVCPPILEQMPRALD